MNLRFVEAFYWVATLKSVTRAAGKLNITQSAMSSRVAALEEELGVALLDRSTRTFRLTTSGARFLTQAERLLELQREIKAELGKGIDAAIPLHVGAIESVLHSWLMPWIGSIRGERPVIEFDLTVETTPMLLEQIQRGTLDLAFAAAPASGDGIRTRTLPSMEMVFVGNSRRHKRKNVDLEELASEELLTFQRGSQPHGALVELFRQVKLEPKRIHAISSISAMSQLVEAGFGVATLPRSAAERLLVHRELRLLTPKTPLQPLPIFASYRADAFSHSLEAIVDSALAFIAEHEPPPPKAAT